MAEVLTSYRHRPIPKADYEPGVRAFVPGEGEPVSYRPRTAAEPGSRRRYADLPMDIKEAPGGLLAVGTGTTIPRTIGRREVTGACKRHGVVVLYIHCHDCGQDGELVLGNWSRQVEQGAKRCQGCNLQDQKRRGFSL